jgi:hypothetical protein
MRLFLIASLLLLACGDEVDDRPASFTYLYATVFEPNCTTVGCHNGFSQTFGVELDSVEGAYETLVGAQCDPGQPPTDPLRTFVRPGDPERSRLIRLLEGDDVAPRMPPDSPLPVTDIELVRQWILDGAECN